MEIFFTAALTGLILVLLVESVAWLVGLKRNWKSTGEPVPRIPSSQMFEPLSSHKSSGHGLLRELENWLVKSKNFPASSSNDEVAKLYHSKTWHLLWNVAQRERGTQALFSSEKKKQEFGLLILHGVGKKQDLPLVKAVKAGSEKQGIIFELAAIVETAIQSRSNDEMEDMAIR